MSVLSQISNCQGLGRKKRFEILKTYRSSSSGSGSGSNSSSSSSSDSNAERERGGARERWTKVYPILCETLLKGWNVIVDQGTISMDKRYHSSICCFMIRKCCTIVYYCLCMYYCWFCVVHCTVVLYYCVVLLCCTFLLCTIVDFVLWNDLDCPPATAAANVKPGGRLYVCIHMYIYI